VFSTGGSDPDPLRVRIRIQHFRLGTDPDPIRIQDFDEQKVANFTPKKKYLYFFLSKNGNIFNSRASIKDVQATGEAISLQKTTSSTSIHEISSFFLFLWAIFALLVADPDSEFGSTDLIESGPKTVPKH
jgi:hypothetical protein